uniref:CCHC-type domain-containing protein n=3 Tax=Oryzias latipes TaxID=8090 RepID=A0A3P9II99_ORYLA
MDVFEKFGIKIPNAVAIDGFTKTETDDEEIFGFLSKYGSISKTRVIDEPDSAFNQKLIVEFSSGVAIAALRDILPYTFVGEDKTTTCKISELSTLCAAHVEKTMTNTYLQELQTVAKRTGKNYAEVLRDVMSLLGHSVAELGSQHPEDEVEMSPAASSTGVPPFGAGPDLHESPLRSLPEPRAQFPSHVPDLNLSGTDVPGVQRYVVEHIVKNEDTQRLRVFSGRLPRPQNEADFETWRSCVELMMNDPAVSDLQRTRRISGSLLPPAADMVKHLNPQTSPAVYIHILESAYGTVQDGEELYAKFMDTFQNTGEKPSAYLQRLQVSLTAAVKRGGVPPSEVDKRLLNQFCRGCWDNTLITELQLKQRKPNPPPFSDLLLLLRIEEDREASKMQRMRQYLGPAKVKTHVQYAYSENEEKPDTTTIQQLAKQIADIQRQLASLTAAQSSSKPKGPKATSSSHSGEGQWVGKPQRNPPSAPKPGYCFRCGEDGHIKPQCSNPPNSALVAAKKKLFNEKHSKWTESRSSQHQSLN